MVTRFSIKQEPDWKKDKIKLDIKKNETKQNHFHFWIILNI